MQKSLFPIYIYNSRHGEAFSTNWKKAKTIFFHGTHDSLCFLQHPEYTLTSQETEKPESTVTP